MKARYLLITLLLLVAVGSASADLTTDNEAYYTFDEGSGSTAADSTPNGYDGTISGASWVTSGIIGDALDFDGSNDNVEAVGLTMEYGTGDFTVNAWINPDSTTNGQIIGTFGSSSSGGLIVDILSNNNLRIWIDGDNLMGGSYSTGTWQMVTFVRDSGSTTIYKDASSVATGSSSANVSNTDNAVIGTRTDGVSPFDGRLDEISVWDRALTTSEISDLYASGSPGTAQQYPYSTPTSNNFTITAEDNFTTSTINTFSALINGTTYTTTNGTINTGIASNSTSLYNITVFKEGYSTNNNFVDASLIYDGNLSTSTSAKTDTIARVEANYGDLTGSAVSWSIYAGSTKTPSLSSCELSDFRTQIEVYNPSGIATPYTNFNCWNGSSYVSTGTGLAFAATINESVLTVDSVNISPGDSYFSRDYNNYNVSNDLNTELTQAYAYFFAENILNQSLSGFDVTIDGETLGNEETWNISAGDYNVTASKTGYYPVTQEIGVSPQQNNTYTFSNLSNHKLLVTISSTSTAGDFTEWDLSLNSSDYASSYSVNTSTRVSVEDTLGSDQSTSSTSFVTLWDVNLSTPKPVESFDIAFSCGGTSGSCDYRAKLTSVSGEVYYTETVNKIDGVGGSFPFASWNENNAYQRVEFQARRNSGTASPQYRSGTEFETLNPFVLADLMNGTYDFSFSADTWATKNFTLDLGSGDNFTYYDIAVQAPRTFDIEFFNETTDELLNNNNVTAEFISDSNAFNKTTSNGTLLLELLTPDDYVIKYRIDGSEVVRDYFVTLTPESYEELDLYLIDESISAYYVATVLDASSNACQQNTVSLLRYYIDENQYKVVEMSRTNSQGQAVFRVKPNNVDYKFLFTGSCGTFTSAPTRLIDSENSYTITGGQELLESLYAFTGASTSLTYVNGTQTFAYTWTSSSNIITRGCLEVLVRKNGVRSVEGEDCASGNTGTAQITISDTNETTYFAQGTLYTSTEFSDSATNELEVSFVTGFFEDSAYAPFAALILFVAVVMALGASASGLVVGSVASLVSLSFFNFVSVSAGTIFSFITLAVAILYLAGGRR